MPYEGLPLSVAKELGEVTPRNTTRATKTYTLTVTVQVTGEQDYLNWFEKNIINQGFTLTDQDLGCDGDFFMPDYNGWLDDDLFCEHPDNYAYDAWCEGVDVKIAVPPRVPPGESEAK